MRPFVTIAVVAIIAPLARPCEDIAVVSYDAKYMLLDGETLETRDVGNLRWMGVWGVDAVIPGSTSARFAFVTGALSAEFAQPDESGFFQGSALVVVTNLAERDNTASGIAISHGYEFAPTGDARLWIDGTDQLLVREGKRSRVTVLDEGLNEVEVWSAAKWDTGPLLACRRGGNLYVAAGTRRATRRDSESIVDELAIPEGFEDCRVENRNPRSGGIESPSVGCRGTLGCRRNGRYVRAVVDIADNKVVAWHESEDSAKLPEGDQSGSGGRTYLPSVLLFADGNRLLRQQSTWIPLPDGPSAFRAMRGPRLRTVDTRSGQVLKDNPRTATGRGMRLHRTRWRAGNSRCSMATANTCC